MKVKVKIKDLGENAVMPFKTYDKDFCYEMGIKDGINEWLKTNKGI